MGKGTEEQKTCDLYIKELGWRISYWRKKRKMTQTQLEIELAKKLTGKTADDLCGRSFTGNTISRYECGKRTMDVRTLFALAEILNVTLDELSPEQFRKKDKPEKVSGIVHKIEMLSKKNLEIIEYLIDLMLFEQRH